MQDYEEDKYNEDDAKRLLYESSQSKAFLNDSFRKLIDTSKI